MSVFSHKQQDVQKQIDRKEEDEGQIPQSSSQRSQQTESLQQQDDQKSENQQKQKKDPNQKVQSKQNQLQDKLPQVKEQNQKQKDQKQQYQIQKTQIEEKPAENLSQSKYDLVFDKLKSRILKKQQNLIHSYQSKQRKIQQSINCSSDSEKQEETKVVKPEQHQKNLKNSNQNNPHSQKLKRKQDQSNQKLVQIQQKRRPVHIVAVSDNHGDYKMMNQILQLKGDIFIHAGDFTYNGKDQHFQKFFKFLDEINFRHKIVIAGNHQNIMSKMNLKTITTLSRQKIFQQLKKRCIYLEHESIQLQGIKIFGSPYTPQYCSKPMTRAFQYKPDYDKSIWNNVPKDIQLLVTHGPPYGILDSGKGGKKAGSIQLRDRVRQIKPKYHLFGHIHQSQGMNKIENTIYINLTNTPTKIVI